MYSVKCPVEGEVKGGGAGEVFNVKCTVEGGGGEVWVTLSTQRNGHSLTLLPLLPNTCRIIIIIIISVIIKMVMVIRILIQGTNAVMQY